MKDLLDTIVRPLVDNEEVMQITEHRRGNQTILNLKLASEDMGRVIGKGGKRATAIRNIMKARAFQERRRVSINIGE
ncbi:MAG TPA: KH domain-containing protein [Fastidiosipila sp.]|jgi:predicted RNA-binding protein YlqC (UPF0109 family)|nr:KH domain-containing protein [Fastidiosipila sp.]